MVQHTNHWNYRCVTWPHGVPNQCQGLLWRHQMETFSALLAICAGNHRSPVNSPHKGQWRGALKFSLICVWINDWVNDREAGDLRRNRTHYDVIVMFIAVREMSGRKFFLKVRKLSGNLTKCQEILTFGKIDENRHGISHNVKENDHFRQHDSPVSMDIDQLAKSRLRNFLK